MIPDDRRRVRDQWMSRRLVVDVHLSAVRDVVAASLALAQVLSAGGLKTPFAVLAGKLVTSHVSDAHAVKTNKDW